MQAEFVETIPRPEAVVDGRLYISLKYNVTLHRCASGCGQLVPLPLSPVDWSFSYDGENVSLSPSVGNGLLNCRSHYLIKGGKIVWLLRMSEKDTLRQQQIDTDLLQVRPGSHQNHSADSRKRSFLTMIWHKLRNILSRD